jgi:transposase
MEGEVLRDDQGERLREFVPSGRKGKRGPRSDGRLFLNALLWLARSGGRWRDLPERFGPYRTEPRRVCR